VEEDGVEFRRARLAIGGTIYEDFIYNAEYDFAEDAEFKDVFLGALLPAGKDPEFGGGKVRIGHYKEFGSLDELISDNDTLFIERALPNVFVPSRNVGLGADYAFFGNEDGDNQRMTIAAGVFRDTDDFGFGTGDGDGYAFTGRATGVPWQSEDGANVLHAGIWGSVRGTESDDFRIRQRPEIHLAPRYLDTFDEIGAIDGAAMFGGELGLTHGRFTAMAEYLAQMLEREGAEDVLFSGFYAQFGAFLTKDHRGYKHEEGIFDKVKPSKPFSIGKDREGWGAWEAALRYSHLDLDDEDVDAGTMDDITVGVNWFINPNLRWSLNYVHAWVDRDNVIVFLDGTADEETFPAVDGDFDGVVTRFQVTW
jgi:phosphate-selective porin OprO/OprP